MVFLRVRLSGFRDFKIIARIFIKELEENKSVLSLSYALFWPSLLAHLG